jgi:hypothetical protein
MGETAMSAAGNSWLNKTRSTEWLLATCACAWGVAILQPEAAFSLPAYKMLSELLRETTWGAMALIIGVSRYLGLFINGWWFRSPLIRAAGTLTSGVFWISLFILIYAASNKTGAPLAAGSYFYPVFFIFEGWCLAAAGYDMQKNGSLSVRSR